MNKLPVYLYPNVFEVMLDLDETRSIHKIMYQRKLKIQKGFKDSIQIQFKNSDQKPVGISTGTYYFDMIDSDGRQLVLSKPLSIVDDAATTSTRGIALASFDPFDTINLVAGSYKFIVKQDNGDGTFTPAYSDTYYGITGEVEIVEDGFPIGFPIQTVSAKELESSLVYDRDMAHMGYVFTTDWLRPKVRPTTTNTTSTARFTLSSFAGEIIVEGTMDNSPSPIGQANAQAFTVTNYVSSTPAQGTIDLSWTNNCTAVRFKVRPSTDGFSVNYYPTGNPVGSQNNKFPNGFIAQIQYIC